MSIYCTRLDIDPDSNPDGLPPLVAYLGSHVAIAPGAWRFGSLDTAHIPPWCAHGADPADEATWRPVPYLRLTVAGWDWRADTHSETTVVLDEAQVRALRDDLTHWLDNREDRA